MSKLSCSWKSNFIIGFLNLNKIEVQEHFTEVLTILRKQIFISPEGERFQVAFNYGLAEFPQDGKTLNSLYQVCVQR